jgi:hypothetical protein
MLVNFHFTYGSLCIGVSLVYVFYIHTSGDDTSGDDTSGDGDGTDNELQPDPNPCIEDPNAEGCEEDPCIEDPTLEGCEDPCIEDPTLEGCEPGDDCDPSYPNICVPSPPPDLNCNDVSNRNFKVVGSDPHGFYRITMVLDAKVVAAVAGVVVALAEGVAMAMEVPLQQVNVKDKPIAFEGL